MPEILEHLSTQTGQPLSAGKDYTHQKVSVLFAKLSLPDALQALAAAVDGVWLEFGGPAQKTFRLEASDRRKARLERFRNARRTAEELADRALLDQLKRALAEADRRNSDADNPPPIRFNPKPIHSVLRLITEEQWQRVITQGNEGLSTSPGGGGPDKTPGLILPLAWLPAGKRAPISEFLRTVQAEALNNGARPESVEAHTVFADHPEALRIEVWRMRVQGDAGLLNRLFATLAGGSDWSQDYPIGNVLSPGTEEPLEPTNALIPPSTSTNDSREDSKIPEILYGPARLDRAFIEIARAAQINVAVEYYTSPGAVPLLMKRGTLREALRRTESHPLVRFWSGHVLVVRSRDWPFRYDREPPASLIDRWDHDRKHEGAVLLDAYLDAVGMADDRRLNTLFGHGDDQGHLIYREEAVKLLRNRFVLRGYRSLSSSQRRQAEQATGLQLARLTSAGLAHWRPVLDRFPYLPNDALQHLRLRIVHSEPRTVLLPRFFLLGIPGVDALPLVTE